MLEYARTYLHDAEKIAQDGDLKATLEALKKLSLDDFAELLMSLPNAGYPAMSALLPNMTPQAIQERWTGHSGLTLLLQSIAFVQRIRTGYNALSGKRLEDATVLDYGCGYGRLLRLMMRYVDLDKLHGCDPWDVSLGHARADNIPVALRQSDIFPERLPYEDGTFDFIYAFSIYTHTSKRATQTSLAALRKAIKDDGVMVITIRPIEYWASDPRQAGQLEALERAHREDGFAFSPHDMEPIDGDITYGDTSMTFEALEALAPGWRIDSYDRNIDDGFQILIYMRPC